MIQAIGAWGHNNLGIQKTWETKISELLQNTDIGVSKHSISRE